jgi:hypothetical protein
LSTKAQPIEAERKVVPEGHGRQDDEPEKLKRFAGQAVQVDDEF